MYWPFDVGIVDVWMSQYWLLALDRCSWIIAPVLGISLGLVGLFRNGWLPRLVSAAGIWISVYLLWLPLYNPLGWVYREITWYLFDVPQRWISEIAGGNAGAETTIWAATLMMAWLLTRPLLKRAYRQVRRLERSINERWPVMSKFAKPVV
jgi:hypothetical protein